MISVIEIKAKALRWWDDKSFLRSIVEQSPYFPKDIPQIGLVKNSEKAVGFLAISEEQNMLFQSSKEVSGYGYTLEWEEKNHQKIGRNRFIRRIYFDSQEDYLSFIGKKRELENFNTGVALILSRLPNLKEWIVKNPLEVINYQDKWPEILEICEYFLNSHVFHKFYIRELPVKAHTKFLESSKGLFISLLDFLLPPEKIIDRYSGQRNFEKRYGLKFNQPLMRIKILDQFISDKFFSGLTDISIPESDLINLNLPVKNAIIMENKTNYSNILNFLSLPLIHHTVAIFGSGFRVWLLKRAAWLSSINIYYWGDIDVQGFQILSQLRGYHPSVQAIMMDFTTLNLFKDYWDVGTESAVRVPENLTEKEKQLFLFLQQNNIRLEQEKISHGFVLESFANLL
jgi:hypothetical protein